MERIGQFPPSFSVGLSPLRSISASPSPFFLVESFFPALLSSFFLFTPSFFFDWLSDTVRLRGNRASETLHHYGKLLPGSIGRQSWLALLRSGYILLPQEAGGLYRQTSTCACLRRQGARPNQSLQLLYPYSRGFSN